MFANTYTYNPKCTVWRILVKEVLNLYCMKQKIKKLIIDNAEILRYLIVGVLTTAVSLGSYFILVRTVLNPESAKQLQLANVISWFLAVLFAFFANRKYVFRSKEKDVISEIGKFFASRIGTLVVDMAIMFLLVTVLKMSDVSAKLIVQVVVLVLNYVLSKIFVFTKNGNKNGTNLVLRNMAQIAKNSYFIFSVLVTVIIFGVYARVIFVTDSYCDTQYSVERIMNDVFLPSGRFITAFFAFLFKTIHISAESAYVLSYLLAIVCVSMSVFLLKEKIYDRHIKNQPLSFLLSAITIINPFTVELIAFYEKGVMFLGILFCVLGAMQFQKFISEGGKKKIFGSLAYAFLAACSYQGVFGLYIVLLTFINIFENKKVADFVKNTAISVLLYVSGPVIDLVIAKSVASGGRVGGNIRIAETISIILSKAGSMIGMYNIVPARQIYILVAIITIIVVAILVKSKQLSMKKLGFSMLKAMYLGVVIVLAAWAPYVIQDTDTVGPAARSAYVLASTIGLVGALLYGCFGKIKKKYSYVYSLSAVYCIVILAVEFFSFTSIGVDAHITTMLDRQNAARVIDIIHAHEDETGEKMKYIIPYYGEKPVYMYNDIKPIGDASVSAYKVLWSNVELINQVSGEKYIRQARKEDKSCNELGYASTEEQFVFFEGDRVILCIY